MELSMEILEISGPVYGMESVIAVEPEHTIEDLRTCMDEFLRLRTHGTSFGQSHQLLRMSRRTHRHINDLL